MTDIRQAISLALRGGRDKATVIKPNGEKRVMLGVTHPQDDEQRRAAVQQQWRGNVASPRQQPGVTLDEPLPTRTQTILSHRMPEPLRDALNSGASSATTRDDQEGCGPVTVTR